MKKTAIIAIIIMAASISLSVYAKSPSPPKKKNTGWRKLIWVDEKGVRHVTYVIEKNRKKTSETENTSETQNTSETENAPRGVKKLPVIINAKVKTIKGVEKIELTDGRTVRYIGISGPPENNPAYDSAVAYHKKKIEGKWVNIMPGHRQYDSDGNIWGFVFINQMTFVNAELIKAGFARSSPLKPNTDYSILFDRLEKKASRKKTGMWKE